MFGLFSPVSAPHACGMMIFSLLLFLLLSLLLELCS